MIPHLQGAIHEGAGRTHTKTLVSNPDAVEVKETEGDTGLFLELRVAKEDLGRVIGKYGHTVTAIRVILSAVAARTRSRVTLEIIEEK